MPTRSRTCALAVVAVAAVPVLAGCSTSPGAAALVGDQRISTGDLQHQVRLALVDPAAATQVASDRAGFTRDLLGYLISKDVTQAAAARRHVTVTAQDVSAETASFAQQAGSLTALRQQASAGGIPADQLSSYIRSVALEDKLADSLVASVPASPAQLQAAYNTNISKFEQAHVAHILVASKALATRLLARVKRDPSSFASLAARYSTDAGSKSKGGDLGFVGKGTTAAAFDAAAFSAPVGSYVLAHSQYGYHVIHVIARRTESLAQATPALKDQLFATQRTALLKRALAAESRSLGVHVSPRYGRWNAGSETVVAATSPISSSG